MSLTFLVSMLTWKDWGNNNVSSTSKQNAEESIFTFSANFVVLELF